MTQFLSLSRIIFMQRGQNSEIRSGAERSLTSDL